MPHWDDDFSPEYEEITLRADPQVKELKIRLGLNIFQLTEINVLERTGHICTLNPIGKKILKAFRSHDKINEQLNYLKRDVANLRELFYKILDEYKKDKSE